MLDARSVQAACAATWVRKTTWAAEGIFWLTQLEPVLDTYGRRRPRAAH